MTILVLERQFDPPLSKQDVVNIARAGAWCFEQYQVDWLGSMLSADGQSMICSFSGRDAETIRQALTKIDTDTRILWIATIHESDNPGPANVIVERSFGEAVRIEDLQAREDAKQWCLDAHDVRFVRTYFSTDHKRMLCLYAAPDAEAVIAAQREAEMPFERIWAFRKIDMADAAA